MRRHSRRPTPRIECRDAAARGQRSGCSSADAVPAACAKRGRFWKKLKSLDSRKRKANAHGVRPRLPPRRAGGKLLRLIAGWLTSGVILTALACGQPASPADGTNTAQALTTAATATTTAAATAPPAETTVISPAQETATPAPTTATLTELIRVSANLVSPAFSPDGSRVAGGAVDGLEVGSADGSNLRSLEPDATSFSWSPDSSMLAATVVRGGLTNSLQPAELVVVAADGSSRVDLGESDFPAYAQYLADGRVAYVRGGRLHLTDPRTGEDVMADKADPIVNDDSSPPRPFSVSDDGRFVATMRRTTLYVQDLVSGVKTTLTESIDGRRFSGYGWSPDGTLAYSDVDSSRSPVLHLFDPLAGTDRALWHRAESGVLAGVSWSNRSWIIVLFIPAGTAAEALSEYQAVDVRTGASTTLTQSGSGFSLSGGGRKLVFLRRNGPQQAAETWVATLAFR